ncbi:MAG: hypothetical protein WAO52_16780 [Prolixibacteraceae bacterium]
MINYFDFKEDVSHIYAAETTLTFDQHDQYITSFNIPVDRYHDSIQVKSQKESIEPILTEETLPNEPGEWDLRFNIDYTKQNNRIYTALPQVQLFFGIFRNVGGEISLPLYYSKGEKVEYGFGSVSTSIKWLVVNQSFTFPAFVVGLDIGLPTNSIVEESEERTFEYSPYVAFLKDFGQLCVQGNLALSTEFPVSGGEKNHSTEFNIAFAYPTFDDKINVLAELNSSFSRKEPNELFLSPGIKYHLNDKHFFALAFPVGLYNMSSNFRIFIQYQFQL